ncbi:glycosyltransferase family 4 protein [Ramlibacter sp. USB13]|uniref:Glycosyltransferase family 4 protein n=1 Tax=Ramlibacter cellulosilyticus TaxID=2764187 RepID=A0A923MX38_9BURK|nr:glycosyltransferase [Ramlibacter cellulosilyticus]MBC5786299.1 glycosyltransferase family 4 protein [Ramlibacter cellulosilyticus]
MLILLLLSGLLSFLGCAALLRAGQESSRKYWLLEDVPQRFHVGHVPRLGGAAMLVACLGGWVWMALSQPVFGVTNSIPIALGDALGYCGIALLATVTGLLEDVTHAMRPRWRMLGTFLAAFLAALLFGIAVPRIGIPGLQEMWGAMPWLGMALALFAVAGLPHSINIIDGYNGLAGILTLICCMAIVYVALAVGDRQLAGVMVVLAGATVGFLLWNYPHGLIFAGDGGAYLWGGVIALGSVQLAQRHADVSPWFPVLLLAYPIWETIFSIWRKRTMGRSPGLPDGLHFHHLIFRRVVRHVFHDDDARRMLMRNNRTSPYLLAFVVLSAIPATLFYQNTPVLIGFILLFVITYLWAYYSIVRFRTRRWHRFLQSRR